MEKNIIFLLSYIVALLLLSSCGRYKTTTTHTRDTLYIAVHDSTGGKPKDSLASQKAEAKTDTIFKEIEKDCPNEKGKLPGFKKEIEEAETIESKTGGSVSSHSDSLGMSVLIKFKGDQISAVEWSGKEMVIEDKTEKDTTRERSLLRQAFDVWFLWIPAWVLLFLIVFFRIKKFFS